ncbi:hypothetical protein QYF36_019052 [Acer negundo]|nr:hypothetical protein QYF36_019052 [Acer negundo]
MLLWRGDWHVAILSYSKGHIDAVIQTGEWLKWRFTGFYRCPHPKQMQSSLELLRRLSQVNSLLWVYGGDFNALLSTIEKKGGSEKCHSGVAHPLKTLPMPSFGAQKQRSYEEMNWSLGVWWLGAFGLAETVSFITRFITADQYEIEAAWSPPPSGTLKIKKRLPSYRAGLCLAKRFQLKVSWVERDAKNVVSGILSNRLLNNVASPIIEDIMALFAEVGVVNCLAIPRARNLVAHTLASVAFSSTEEVVSLGVSPTCVSFVL